MEKKCPSPQPILADDVAFRHPPPSYEEVMSAYQTSIKPTRYPEIPPLAYIDIMPKCISIGNWAGNVVPKFGDYSTILEAANRFLLDNPGVVVWKCESVTKRLNMTKEGTLSYELNTMLRHEATFGFLVYIKGLRQGNVTVDDEEYQMTNVPLFNVFDTFERLDNTIQRLDQTLEDDPIPGTIITIEIDKIKAFEQFKSDFDPEATCWTENKDKFRRFTQVIRIFYIKGSSANEKIGYVEFLPELIDAPDTIKPGRFELFENLMHKLAAWVSANQGVRIVNIQQHDAKVNKCMKLIISKPNGGLQAIHFKTKEIYDNFLNSFLPMVPDSNWVAKTDAEVSISSGSNDDFISTFSDQRFARILRVFYTTSSAVKGLPANYITSRLFMPARTGPKSFECMTQTMERIEAWLRITDLPIYSVETVELLFNENSRLGAECEKSDYHIHSLTGKHWVTAIRVYFSTPYKEPDPAVLPPLPSYMIGGSSSCVLL